MGNLAKILISFSLLLFGSSVASAYTLKSYEGRFSVDFPSAPTAKIVRGVGSCESFRHEFRLSEGGRDWMAIYKDCKPPGMLADIGINPTMRDFAEGVATSTIFARRFPSGHSAG